MSEARVGVRDEVWLKQLYDQHWTALVRLASLLLNGSDEAEEIVQEAFVAVYGRRHQLPDDARAAAYLRTAVVNRCRSAHRHRAVVRRHLTIDRDQIDGPEHVTLAHETQERVLAALRKLPQRQQEVLVLRYYSEASEAEIAETLGISKGAVKTHASRGMDALRRVLKGEQP